MKYDAIKKKGEKWVKVRPALQIYNDSGLLTDTVEDAWYLSEITEDRAKIQSRDTGHFKHIGLDHIHHYMDEEDARLRTSGTLVMNVQLLVHEGELLIEPVSAPGQALKTFVRARPRATLMAAASRMRAQTELERARRQFASSDAGIRAADQAFADFPQAFEALHDELRKAGHAVDDFRLRHIQRVYLLRAAGWWAMIYWERKYANTLDGALLTIEQLDRPPRELGLMVFGTPTTLWQESYTFGLAAIDTPRWLPASNPAQSFTTEDLAQEVLTRLLLNPNNEQY